MHACIYRELVDDNGRPYIVQREYMAMRQGYFRTSDTSTMLTIWNVSISVCFAKLCAERRFREELSVYLCCVATSTLDKGDINEIFLFVTLIMSVSLVAVDSTMQCSIDKVLDVILLVRHYDVWWRQDGFFIYKCYIGILLFIKVRTDLLFSKYRVCFFLFIGVFALSNVYLQFPMVIWYSCQALESSIIEYLVEKFFLQNMK